jgi:hypothetical protein
MYQKFIPLFVVAVILWTSHVALYSAQRITCFHLKLNLFCSSYCTMLCMFTEYWEAELFRGQVSTWTVGYRCYQSYHKPSSKLKKLIHTIKKLCGQHMPSLLPFPCCPVFMNVLLILWKKSCYLGVIKLQSVCPCTVPSFHFVTVLCFSYQNIQIFKTSRLFGIKSLCCLI